jgi:hypothetical protein
MSMSAAAIPTFEITLGALSALLDKAEAHAAAKKFDAANLLDARLAPDMFKLTEQVQIACDFARKGAARLSGQEPAAIDDKETTIAELKERIANTLKFVRSVDRKTIDGSADRVIALPLGHGRKGEMTGADYFNHFVLPNLYFHVTAAYAILRHAGLEIGKRDFLGGIPLKIT